MPGYFTFVRCVFPQNILRLSGYGQGDLNLFN